jgi:hypothetical protein
LAAQIQPSFMAAERYLDRRHRLGDASAERHRQHSGSGDSMNTDAGSPLLQCR